MPSGEYLKNGDAKIIKNAGGLVISPFDSAMRSLLVAIYELGVEEIMVVAHSNCDVCAVVAVYVYILEFYHLVGCLSVTLPR